MLLLSLVIAALAATAASASGYADGYEYVYAYKGQIFTGYPKIKSQYSGYAFQANLILQTFKDYGLMKVTNVKNAQFNGEFEDVQRHPHNYVELPAHAEVLTKPFKVYRKNGVVSHFEVTKGESTFSVNLKRGLAALFNLNLEESDGSLSTEDNIQKLDPDSHYYKVYEKGVLGDCETAYVVGHHPHYKTPQNNIVLNVTKVRNYHKCRSTPNQVYGVFHGHECGTADHEKSHTLHGNAQFRYDIRGHRNSYVIEKIYTVGETAYTPYPMEGETVTTHINRYLQLIEEKPIEKNIEFDGEGESFNSLEYDFGFQKHFKDPVDLKKPHYMYHMIGRKAAIQDIRGQVEELIPVYNDDTYQEKIKDRNYPAKFVELLRSLGSVGYEEIEELYNQYADIPKTGASAEQKRYRALFTDALVNLGTNPAFAFGKYLIENKKVKPLEALTFFNQLPYHIKEVSENLLDDLQVLCENENVKKHQHVHIACVFAFSNIIHDHCVARYHPDLPISMNTRSCQPEDAVKYFDYVARNFEQTNDEKLKTAYLKAGGNIGLREILPYLKPYIQGAGNYHRYYRNNAIWAVKNVGFRFHEKVRELLVPLLFNHSENYELRLSAFNVLMIYKPELYAYEGVARALKHDPDDQVRSYIYNTFKAIANSTHPCDRKRSKDAKFALRILEDVHHEFQKYDYSYSRYNYVAGYDSDFDYGGSTTFAYMASDTGFIPRAMYFGLEDYIGGKSFQSTGIGFKQYGLEKLYNKFFGPDGSFGKRSMFDLFKKRGKRSAGEVEKELNEIKEKIKLPVYDFEPIHGEIFYKYMGSHISFFHFDDSTFEDFFKNGRFSIPNLPALYQKVPQFSYQRFMLTVDKFYAIPSESGVPIIFDYKQPIYYYHKNKETSFKVEPGFFPEERGGKWPDNVKLETDGYIAVDKNLFASVGVVIPFDQVIFGAGINRRSTLSLPLKLKLNLDVKQKSLNTKWTPVAPHQIYHFKYEPYTFVDSYANIVPRPLEVSYLPLKRQTRKQFEGNYLHDELGVGFDVRASYENEFNDKGSWLNFFMKKDYRQKFYYIYSNPRFEPYDIDVTFSHAKEGSTKEVEGTIKYNYHDMEYSQPQFSDLGFEDFKLSSGGSGPYCTCEFQATLNGRGDKERKLQAGVSWTRNLLRSSHKINFFYNRSPFLSRETQDLKVCGSSYLKYPQYDLLKVATLDTKEMDHTVQSELKVHFGKDCSSDQKLTIKGQFQTTEEQKEMESRREEPDTPEHFNPYAYLYQACLKERQKGINYGDHCMNYFQLISTVHAYNFHAKYENLSPRFLNFTYKVGGFLKHAFYDYSEHNTIGVQNPSDEFHVHANFSLRLPVADVRVLKPNSISHYTHTYVPMYRGFRSYPVFEDMHVKNSFSEIRCKVEGDNVFTFDRYDYNLPPIDCYKVIAKDCSTKEHFTVLGKKINHPRYHKAIKVFLGKYKIEALPVSEDSDIIVRVNGKRVPVTADTPYIQKEGDAQEFYITFRGFYYALHSEKYGVIVEYDGHGIIVQVAPYYRSKVCGLCGNYNGQKYDGYETAEGCIYDDENAYAYAYAIPSETCTVPKFEPKCPTEGGFGCTKLRTKVLERETNKGPQTCFSLEPISECASHCKASDFSSQTISFHCLPTKDDSTKALSRQAQSRVIYEVKRKSKDFEAAVEVPYNCLKT